MLGEDGLKILKYIPVGAFSPWFVGDKRRKFKKYQKHPQMGLSIYRARWFCLGVYGFLIDLQS